MQRRHLPACCVLLAAVLLLAPSVGACSFLLTNAAVPPSTFSLVNFHLRFRGPDRTRRWRHAPSGLEFVHNLLHMRGPPTPQPLHSADGAVTVLFNGEIYNAGGPEQSDGPAIIDAYRRHGAADFASHLDGEFAIALVDWERDLLVLATDTFGTKPLWLALGEAAAPRRLWGVATYESALQRLGLWGAVQAEPNTVAVRRLSTLALLSERRTRSFDLAQHKDHLEDWTAAFEQAVLKRTRGAAVRYRGPAGAGAHVPFIGLSSGYDSGALGCALAVLGVPHRAYTVLGNEERTVLAHRLAFARERGTLLSHEALELNRSSFAAAQRELYRRVEEYRYEPGHAEAPTDLRDDGGAVGLSSVCARARRDGARVYLSGTGADEIISDYGAFGQKLARHSSFGGRFPANLSSVFPWRSFFKGTQRAYLMKEEMVSGAHGLEGRYPFLDVALVQEYLWLTPRVKNLLYKAPLHAYFSRHGCAFDYNIKLGFSPLRSEGANLAAVQAQREAMGEAPDPAEHVKRCGAHDTSCSGSPAAAAAAAAAAATATAAAAEAEAEAGRERGEGRGNERGDERPPVASVAAGEQRRGGPAAVGVASLASLLGAALAGGRRQLVLGGGGGAGSAPPMPPAVADFLGGNWSDVTMVHADGALQPDVLWAPGGGDGPLPLSDASFDEVLLLRSAAIGGGAPAAGAGGELGASDLAVLLGESQRVLRDGGRLCISLPRRAALPPTGSTGSTGRRPALSLRQLVRAAQLAGFALARAGRGVSALTCCFTKLAQAQPFDAAAAAQATSGLLTGDGDWQLAVEPPAAKSGPQLAAAWQGFAAAALAGSGDNCEVYAQWHERLIAPLRTLLDAERVVLAALELLAGCAVPLLTLGRVQAEQERWSDALATFAAARRGALASGGGARAQRLAQDSLMNLGTVHTRMGALAAAARCFSEGMLLAPRHAPMATNFHKLFIGRAARVELHRLPRSESRALVRVLAAAHDAARGAGAAAAAVVDSALYALGVVLHELGHAAASEAVYRRFFAVGGPVQPRLAAPVHDAARGLRVITMATDPEHAGLRALLDSASAAGLAPGSVSVLGAGAPYVANAMKLELFEAALAAMAPAQLVLATDAYDVLLMPSVVELERRFAAFGAPLVASAETGCWPDAGAAGLYPAPPPEHAASPFRFLNSGAIVGAAGPFLAMLRTMKGYGSCFVSDQRCFARYFLEHPGTVALDHGAELFANLYGIRNSTFTVTISGQVTGGPSGTSPCLLHGNGGEKPLFEALARSRLRARKEQATIHVRV